jgi:hypothetical protein
MIERRLLQAAVAICSAVPIGAGAMGVWQGPRIVGSAASLDLDSHFRYLSGLLLAIGLGYLSTVPRIETHRVRFTLLTAIVVGGGLGRLIAVVAMGWPSPSMSAALAMELLVTPGLALWQARVAARFR